MTTPVPGPPASILAAVSRQDPGHPYTASNPSQRRYAWISPYAMPWLPSLVTDEVFMPQYALLDCNTLFTGYVSTQGLPGAVAASRWVGATTSGAPTSGGPFAAGDFVIDQTGTLWICQSGGSPGTWVNAAAAGAVISVTAGDASIVIGGTATAPTVATGTLDVIAANHPPAANWSNNGKKITSIGNGTASTDAAAFGQVGVTSVAAGDTSIVVGGTAGAPTIATGTLDVIATQHPPAAAWSNNSKKITSLANGTVATDAAALGQVVQSVAATDASIVVGGTASAPTVATGTLDVIAAQHPPAAGWSNNNKKITNLLNGTAAQDAATFGQIPVVQTPASFAPANPTGTASTSQVMMGLGSTCTYTPSGSGTVQIRVNVIAYAVEVTAAGISMTIGARYGTSGAPGNNTPNTGTAFGAVADPQVKVSTLGTASQIPVAFTAVLALTAGTAYWFDLALSSAAGADTVEVVNVMMSFGG